MTTSAKRRQNSGVGRRRYLSADDRQRVDALAQQSQHRRQHNDRAERRQDDGGARGNADGAQEVGREDQESTVMASVTVAALKMMVRPAVATVAMIAALMFLAVVAFLAESRHHQQAEVDGQPEAERGRDGERVRRDIGDSRHEQQHQQRGDDRGDADDDGQEGGDETAEHDDQDGERDGQRDALADLEIVLDLGSDLLLHAEGAAGAHCDVRVVGQTCDDVRSAASAASSGGPAHVDEDQPGATVACCAGRWPIRRVNDLVTFASGSASMTRRHLIRDRRDLGTVDGAFVREHLNHQVRGGAEILVEEVVGLRRFRRSGRCNRRRRACRRRRCRTRC